MYVCVCVEWSGTWEVRKTERDRDRERLKTSGNDSNNSINSKYLFASLFS